MRRLRLSFLGFCLVIMLSATSTDAAFIPGDTYWASQWGPVAVEADDTWNPHNDPIFNGYPNPGKKEIIVAIIDYGIDKAHPDLSGVLWDDGAGNCGIDYGDDTPDNDPGSTLDHGTMVAGVISAVTHNGLGISGLAQVKLMIIKILTDSGEYNPPEDNPWKPFDDGLNYAKNHGADIVVMQSSLFGIDPEQSMRNTIKNVFNENNILICAAIGNWNGALDANNDDYWDFTECDSTYPYMDMNDEILTVGATDTDDERWEKSLYNDYIGVMAPGVNIKSTKYQGYLTGSGTSMASPCVAGIAALILSQQPTLTSKEIKNIIEQSADDIIEPSGHGGPPPGGENPQPGWDRYTGYGLVNCKRAFDMVTNNKRTWAEVEEYSSVKYFSHELGSEAIEVDQYGNIHLLTINDANHPQVIYRKIDSAGTTIINDMTISDVIKNNKHPDLFIDAYNNVHIIWVTELGSGIQDYLMYAKYNSDMTNKIIEICVETASRSSNPFRSPKLVVTPTNNQPKAFIFYDEYEATNGGGGIFYRTVDKLGTIGGEQTFRDSNLHEVGEDGGLDIDISYLSADERIHVVWQESLELDYNIKYWSIYSSGSYGTEYPLTIADSTSNERYPKLDAQWLEDIVHVVYEDWQDSEQQMPKTRENQIIKYCVINPNGEEFYYSPTNIGTYTDHNSIDNRGKNGKLFPSVAYSSSNIITIAWREWQDDYSEGNGYFSLYYSQYYISFEKLCSGYSIHCLFPDEDTDDNDFPEKILFKNINEWEQQWDKLGCIITASDHRIRYSLMNQYCLDSNFYIIFHLKLSTGNYRYALMTTREYWRSFNDIGFLDQRQCFDPDIDIDFFGQRHLVYATVNPSGNPPHTSIEIHYRNENMGNDVIVSGNIQYQSDGFDSVNPRIVTRQMFYQNQLTVFAYIFWIDYKNSLDGELYFTIVDINGQFVNLWQIFWPMKVPFLTPQVVGQSQHEIVCAENGIIHVVYEQSVPDEYTGTRSTIHHGSINIFGHLSHVDSEIASEIGYNFENPAIDARFDGNVFVVYSKTNLFCWDIYADVLTQILNPNLHMVQTAPFLMHDPMGMAKSYNPKLKIEKPILRNAMQNPADVDQSLFIHVVWVEQDPITEKWMVIYSKWRPFCQDTIPEISDVSINPISYVESNNIPNPELVITKENDIGIIFSAKTLGYGPNPPNQDLNRLFFVSISPNGLVKTTNMMISNGVNIVNMASDINNLNVVFCAWDTFNNLQQAWGQTIYWREYYSQDFIL